MKKKHEFQDGRNIDVQVKEYENDRGRFVKISTINHDGDTYKLEEIRYTEGGQLESKIYYKNGHMHGPYQMWYDDGAVDSLDCHVDGCGVGPYLSLRRNGAVHASEYYPVNGNSYDISVDEFHRLYLNEDWVKDIVTVDTLRSNGGFVDLKSQEKTSAAEVQNGRSIDVEEHVNKYGRFIKTSTIHYGGSIYKLEEVRYTEGGQLKSKTYYKNDRKHGPYQRWYDDGTVFTLDCYVDGYGVGAYLRLYSNGRLDRSSYYPANDEDMYDISVEKFHKLYLKEGWVKDIVTVDTLRSQNLRRVDDTDEEAYLNIERDIGGDFDGDIAYVITTTIPERKVQIPEVTKVDEKKKWWK